MRRYWIEPHFIQDKIASIEGDSYRHIIGVCRHKEGQSFELICGTDVAYFVELTQIGKKSAQAKVLESRKITTPGNPQIHLALSVPRFQKLDEIIEKSVEMGVHTLHPFVSDFSFVRSVDSRLASREKRWSKIIKMASQQSGRGHLMEIADPCHLDKIWDRFNPSDQVQGLFSYEGDGGVPLRDRLEESMSSTPTEIWVFVGSEGGFSEKEVQVFKNQSLNPVTLGEQVLRVETACVALVAIIKYRYGLLS